MKITKKRVEMFKTILLNVLVVTSLLLTWQIWTYEPEYEQEIAPTEASPVGVKEVSIGEVVKPNQVVYHRDDQHFTSFYSNTINTFYNEFVSGVKIKSFTMENNMESLLNVGNSVELIFPTLLSNDVLKKLVSVSKDDIPLASFDRIIIPSVASGKNNEIIFLNTINQVGMRATVDASNDIKNWYSDFFASFDVNTEASENMKITRAKPFQVADDSPVFYVPIQGVEVETYGGSTDELTNEKAFKEALFPELDRVEESTFNISTLYTDGSRDLTFNDNAYMVFKNPPSTTSRFVANEAPILTAYGFINKHYGFRVSNLNEDEYYLNEWITTSDNNSDQITFRLNTEGYPLFSSSMEDLDEIDINIENNEVSTYKRMLKVIQYAAELEARTLPGYEEFIGLLDSGNFKKSELRNITIGFTIDRTAGQSYDFTLVPQWYVKVNQTWIPLQSIDNGGGGAFGLE
ncbi:two-component system activity regulator YycH [Pseudalkalibacillus hwajinpoensis]|uniref:YycH family regulatory protein n=1 Tax=Guptibacillus hwajinpoensis TaxID=208199 RepID=UPI00325AC894